MRLHAEITLVFIASFIWFQHALCDNLSKSSGENTWTCTCSISRQQSSNFAVASCSSSCDCTIGGGDKWACVCSSGALPKMASVDSGSNCFTSCNCNAGTLSESETTSKTRNSTKVVVIVILLCIVLTALVFALSLVWYVFRKDKHRAQWTPSSSDRLTSFSSATNLISRRSSALQVYRGHLEPSDKSLACCIPKTILFRSRRGTIHGTITRFSYFELESATNKFSEANLIGVGGSSHVYKGTLRDGKTVAIKKMKTQSGPDAEDLFLTEIEMISRLHHFHVVPLLGYCLETRGKNAERLLVFEYFPYGNLRECIDGDLGQCLDWATRVAIALGAARGLEYLHEAAAPRILHRDVKSMNILLDEKWRAKITDLGMAKHLHNNDGVLSCPDSPGRMQGTFGYFAPENSIIGRASLKSDVFSFGVVLLELITGRKPIQKSSNKRDESLVIWATPRLHDSKRVITELPDPRLNGEFEEEEMQVMAYLAKECLLLDPDSRPSMREVVQILSSIAPDKSTRQNLSIHALRSCSSDVFGSRNIKPETPSSIRLSNVSTTASHEEEEEEEIKQMTSEIPRRCSSSLSNRCCDFVVKKLRDADVSSDVEKLILLTSKSKNWRMLQKDEVVDLIEPRLESFCLPDVDSKIVKVTS